MPKRGAYRALARVTPSRAGHDRGRANAAPGCGLAIGNLSSQLFANIYLHELDLFVKHVLKARRYVRYVDDFVLVHEDQGQLLGWQEKISQFLADKLGLRLKKEKKAKKKA